MQPLHSWTKNIRFQYSETNVMHFLFNLLRIKGLYMFRAGHAVAQLVEALRYKPEGRGFDSR
jgi:hypothetical protein